MRTVTLFGLSMIADAISRYAVAVSKVSIDQKQSDALTFLLGIILFVCIVMDIVEFIKNLFCEKG